MKRVSYKEEYTKQLRVIEGFSMTLFLMVSSILGAMLYGDSAGRWTGGIMSIIVMLCCAIFYFKASKRSKLERLREKEVGEI